MIADSDLNDIMKKRNRGEYEKNGRQTLICNSLKFRVLVMLKRALDYKNSFVEDVRTIKVADINGFCYTILEL